MQAMLQAEKEANGPGNVRDHRPQEAPATAHVQANSLLTRGFSPRSIWALMGPPSYSTTKRPFPKELHRHYYETTSVEAAAATKKFQLLRLAELLKKRQAALHQLAQLQTTLKWANSVAIATSFPNPEPAELMERATRDRAGWAWPNGVPPVLQDPTPDLQAVWAYTYLKHECTNYDELCDQVKGKAFSRYAQPVILHRVNRVILERFPSLPVRGGTGPRTRTCKRCGSQKAGHWSGHYWTTPLDWYAKAKAHKNHTIHEFCSLRCAGEYSQGQARAPLPTRRAKP